MRYRELCVGHGRGRMVRAAMLLLVTAFIAVLLPQFITASPQQMPPPRPDGQGVTGSGSTPVVRQYGPVNGSNPTNPPPRDPGSTFIAPPSANSYYVTQYDPTTFFQLGSSQGISDVNSGGSQSHAIILDFGKPTCKPNPPPAPPDPSACTTPSSPGLGTGLIASGYPLITLLQIDNIAQQFAQGYASQADYGSTLTIIVGTNNSVHDVSYPLHGQAWAQMISRLNGEMRDNDIFNVPVIGGNDMEGDYNDPATTRSWVDAYSQNGFYLLADYGDAAGCARDNYSDVACSNGWYQHDVWYVSYGVGNALAFPEIYAEYVRGISLGGRSDNANQWEQIALYGYYQHGTPVQFLGTLAQHGACSQPSHNQGCSGADNTPDQAWIYLADALDSRTETVNQIPTYSSDISYKPT